jgi:hypothetical protein
VSKGFKAFFPGRAGVSPAGLLERNEPAGRQRSQEVENGGDETNLNLSPACEQLVCAPTLPRER